MTTTVVPGYYIATGSLSLAELYLNGYRVDQLSVQSDMINGRRWGRPGNTADIVMPGLIVTSMSGRRHIYGGANFKWPLNTLSPRMVSYLHTTFWDNDWNADLTVQTYNRATGNWEAYWVTGNWPDYNEEAEPAGGGYHNFVISFVNGVEAPDGVDFALTIAHDNGTPNRNDVVTATIAISNIGDAASSGDIQVDYTIPEHMVFSEVAASEWDISYSTNGTTYSGSAPGDLTTVVALRFIHEAAVAAGADLNDIHVASRADTIGSTTSSATVTYIGDSTSGNNADSEDFSISEVDDVGLSVVHSETTLAVTDELTSTWTVTNTSTLDTDGDLVVDIVIPTAILALTTITATDWVIEYSEDNGSNYNPSPAVIGDVTNLRLTYSTVVSGGDSAPDIVATFEAWATGTGSLDAEVTYTLDYISTNNTSVDSIEVA